ncbi:hypothetical protein E6H34_08660 [Candidatus Bathyarchaeota archaeon]|nr:MAG: hypothetical protein E6H34_08660 [Candidatus Bathyarchaeota archaeon]
MDLLEASLERNGVVHKVSLLLVENAVLAFFYEDSMKIGTLAVSTPGLREGGAGTSSVLLGGKYLIVSRALSERVAAVYNKMSIVSINTKLPEGEALRLYASLLDRARSGSSADRASPKG